MIKERKKWNKTYWSKKGKKYNKMKRLRWKYDSQYREKEKNRKIEWIKNNPEKYQKQLQRKRKHCAKIRFEILKKYSFTCQYCGNKAPDVILQIDHIIPTSKGGTNNQNNLTVACQLCNLGKNNSIL